MPFGRKAQGAWLKAQGEDSKSFYRVPYALRPAPGILKTPYNLFEITIHW
jgi:hypothetical protein